MKKSSLGRRPSAATSRKISDFIDRGGKSSIPIPSRNVLMGSDGSLASSTGVRRRDLSADRMSDYGNIATPSTSRTPRQLTMSTGRMSSIGGTTSKADTRPLGDREWQAKALAAIQVTLEFDDEGRDVLQTCRTLKPMSLMAFVCVSNYFVRQLDSSLEVNKMNYTTELVFILKKLMYKGKVDKMLLQTVNTPHNWPNVLGILHFLSEMIQAKRDFTGLGMEALYRDFMDDESIDEGSMLKIKHIVPLLHHLWDQAFRRQDDVNFTDLMAANQDQISQTLELCGITNEIFEEEKKADSRIEKLQLEGKELQKHYQELVLKGSSLEQKKAEFAEEVDILNNLQKTLKAEQDALAQSENELRYLDDECANQQSILEKYENDDKDNPSAEEYEDYKKNKESVTDEIRFETDMIFQCKENLLDEQMRVNVASKECENLLEEFNRMMTEVLKDDISVRSAICYTRPRLGNTPCNEFTAQLLDKTQQAYTNRISILRSELKCQSDQSAEFELNQEIETKLDILTKLKQIHLDTINQHKEKVTELNKVLNELTTKNDEIENDIVATEEALKKHLSDYEIMENECKVKEERLLKYHEICQKKLELQYQSIVEMDNKMKAMLGELKRNIRHVTEKIKKNKDTHLTSKSTLTS